MAPTGQTAKQFTIESAVTLGHDLVESTLLHELQGIDHQHILANIDAFRTGNAAIHVEVEHGAARIFRTEFLFGIG